ncbi:putative Repressor LexA [Oenococcus oeni]|uniref:LexA family protein n=1 Tax=Oenococcus oeni TaxID=1247 RepID=UPI0010776394|nr:XRE family transcriptional regulator [Oenococcus oeni]AVI94072.1 XRE family transcriptional regulator [Oenococcus oeni]SYV99737.1 putative Repressor LexA [Oenococcus oeni]SYW03926.1 putative Repressor LexA [Oenococcus oeni]SYW17691.1 putative Repressor LexA [Oenococcus oeni]VDC14584.1 putative Repressor LexA [Oenococcus oeni]
MSFGSKLKELRKQKKITQKDLGDLLGNTPPTTVSSWERGQSKPRMDVAAKIAKILNTSVSNLMEDELENYSNVYSQISNSSLSLPIYSHLFAGMPDGAEEDIVGRLEIPGGIAKKYGRKNLLAVKVEGDSMNKVILNGMIAVVNTDDTEVKNGNVYAVIVNGFANTIKHVYKYSDHIRFEPDSFNPANKPFSYRKDEDINIKIVGKLVYIAQDLG